MLKLKRKDRIGLEEVGYFETAKTVLYSITGYASNRTYILFAQAHATIALVEEQQRANEQAEIANMLALLALGEDATEALDLVNLNTHDVRLRVVELLFKP